MENGNNHFSFNPIFPIGRGIKEYQYMPEISKYTDLMKSLFLNIFRRNLNEGEKSFNKYGEHNMRILWERVFQRRFSQSVCLKAPCGAGTATFTVDHHGDVYPCTYFLPVLEEGHKLGDIDDLKNVFIKAKDSIARCRSVEKISDCSICPFNMFCGGGGCSGAIYHTSGLYGLSYYCEYFREMIPFIITETMEIMKLKALKNY